MSANRYLAVDLGAESGRVMLGTLSGEKLVIEEIHRFANRVMSVSGHLHWDVPELEKQIVAGIEKASRRGAPIAGISVDSWAVDYVLLDGKGSVISPPYCYRDARNLESSERIVKELSFAAIYEETGIQFLPFNTLFQLAAEPLEGGPLGQATRLLSIADYFNSRLSGVEVIEQSMASATQLYNPRTQSWSVKLASGRVSKLLPRIVPGGTVLGPVTGKLAKQPALTGAKVIATCSHDTGAAVAAVPFTGRGPCAYLSSGTWSLLGAELAAPVITDASREAGFTNEVGLGGTIRFLKNIAGLWIVQECRRAWEIAGKSFTYDELTQLAEAGGPAEAHLSLQDSRFLLPGDMPEKITAFCRETGQPEPASPGQFVRTILESLALAYAQVLRQLESLVACKFERLHIVGGGGSSRLLNQLTSDATGIGVTAGPVEATAIGNILIQALALGHIESSGHLRRIVENSFPTQTFVPGKDWSDEARARLSKPQFLRS
ncbi:MAG: rhamnulokinase [Methylacidiphilales bacterium]|nr:rhamnulokinase [Candidatus Methylacidiphilales bacterium]